MFTADLGNSQANVDNVYYGLNLYSGDIRSLKGLMEQIRDEVGIPAVRANLDSQGERIGGWEPLQDATFTTPRRRYKSFSNRPILDVRSVLYRSATAKVRWNVSGPDLFVPSTTFVGSNAIYGRLQHEGGPSPWGNIDVPARPFFRFIPEDTQKAVKVVDTWLSDNFNKRIGLKAAGTTVGSVMR